MSCAFIMTAASCAFIKTINREGECCQMNSSVESPLVRWLSNRGHAIELEINKNIVFLIIGQEGIVGGLVMRCMETQERAGAWLALSLYMDDNDEIIICDLSEI